MDDTTKLEICERVELLLKMTPPKSQEEITFRRIREVLDADVKLTPPVRRALLQLVIAAYHNATEV